ncbi:MAG: hypothetical protein ABFE08_06990 [Armatimonadia bacterium]
MRRTLLGLLVPLVLCLCGCGTKSTVVPQATPPPQAPQPAVEPAVTTPESQPVPTPGSVKPTDPKHLHKDKGHDVRTYVHPVIERIIEKQCEGVKHAYCSLDIVGEYTAVGMAYVADGGHFADSVIFRRVAPNRYQYLGELDENGEGMQKPKGLTAAQWQQLTGITQGK